ncbi:winged helix-turn-helix domain-containing protein [Vibrio sp. SCSIO 43137]|uniref:winged helix-turn-helix domain-containing protein n=1 Tax=Vibrio sp. SCSIO 43137 TaxID=3021011 RepID=UPI00230794D1|nr:crosslink repair DNA glycosylase YcaQ family protein [Vibrio sp. SCSIO 43137]WCE32182.1 crosslink repair DNA glycosylase YcaQ family protein [Vibrio sp. SCSIO 43137]
MDSLSPAQARKLILHSQQLPAVKASGSALLATQSAIEHLGYIQIDTISVIERAHHHTLWNRNSRYQPQHIDKLVNDKKVFEYWSHAAAYLPMRDFRYSLPNKLALKSGRRSHWFKKDLALMKHVTERIQNEGPLMAKDFEGAGKKHQGWGSKPAKQALENLFMQGDLMIAGRKNFHKVYDLTERVLPDDLNTQPPTESEHASFLVRNYLKANGLGNHGEITYLLKESKKPVKQALNEMFERGEITPVAVVGEQYFVLPDSLELLNKPLRKSRAKILSPFDNLLIQRKRTQKLFAYDYLLECYTPAAKRKYGYFCLPILWDGKLVARMDCKADRKTSILHIHNLVLEPSLRKVDEFASALKKELALFMTFNGCEQLEVYSGSPVSFI